MTDEKIKEEFEEWVKGLTTEKEAAFANAINNPDQIDLAHGFYGGFLTAERLAKIEVLAHIKGLFLIDATYRATGEVLDKITSMISELKAGN